MSALADCAAALKMDELDFFLKNVALTDRPAGLRGGIENRRRLDRLQTEGASPRRWRCRASETRAGHGDPHLGLGSATRRNANSRSTRTARSVGKIGSQDLGVGNRTAINIVISDTLGLPLEACRSRSARTRIRAQAVRAAARRLAACPSASRKAATEAVNKLFEAVAMRLNTTADTLEAAGGFVRQIDKPDNRIAWKDACAALGPNPIVMRGRNVPNESRAAKLIDQGVGGAQIADVSVDIETGIVTINEMVAVQDVGLIISRKTAESQVYGALIMGITYALFEEAIYDKKTGKMLNPDMEFYRLAGIKDIGTLKVHMMTGPGYDDRGVIGIGEPPVISPGAAISNAVANCHRRARAVFAA
jgi:xanthine dehydrogenase YagR molybdenum-binding subunit